MFVVAGFMGEELEAAWAPTPGERVIHGGVAPVQPAGGRCQGPGVPSAPPGPRGHPLFSIISAGVGRGSS